jgi:hypothetical protein
MAERERRLTLPDRQRIRRDERVAELKAKDTKLGEMRVADGELGLILADVVEGNVLVLGFLVMDDGVPLGERSSLDILTGDSDVLLLEREGSERERLGSRPVDVRALGDGLASGLEDSSEVLVRGEAVGEGGDDLSDLLEHRLVRSRRLGGNDVLGELLGSGESVPGRGEPLLGRGLVVLGALVGLLEHAPDPFLVLLDVLLGKGALLDEPVNVLGEDGRLGGDGLVHPRLGERRLIGLVVTVLSVADDVDDDVLLELGPPVGGELADKVDGLDVVSVDVEDGGVDRLGDVGAVGRRTGESGVCRETNLVVDDDVDGSSGSVVGERVHAHRLVDDSLTGERSVSVEKNTHSGVVVDLVSLKVLDGSGLTQNDGVLALEMGRIGDERERNLLPGRRRSDVVGAEVVLDVTSSRVVGVSRSLAVRVRGNKETREYKSGEERKKNSERTRPRQQIGQQRPSKAEVDVQLVEDGFDRLPDDVGENVQPSSMRHSQYDGLRSCVDTPIDQRFHPWDETLATLQTEPLLVWELGSDEVLETVGPHESVEDHSLLLDGVFPRMRDLDSLSNPVALMTVGDVDVLNTDVAAWMGRKEVRKEEDEERRKTRQLEARANKREGEARRTIDPLERLDDLSQRHLGPSVLHESRENSRSKSDLKNRRKLDRSQLCIW